MMGRIRLSISLSNTLPKKVNRLIGLKEVRESSGLFGFGINIIFEHFHRIG